MKHMDYIYLNENYYNNKKEAFTFLIDILKKNGTALVFHLFNEFDVDVIIKYRNNKYFDTYEPGWNNHSIQTIKKNLNKVGLKLIKTHKFQLSIDDFSKEDPARAWTAYVGENKKFINGLGLMFDLICLEISK